MIRRALPFALVLATIGACGFPDLAYEAAENDGGVSDGAMPEDRGSSSSSGADVSSDGSSGGSDAASEGTTDESSSSSGGDEGGTPCDRDGDGFDNAGCGGKDCCDSDTNAHPMQSKFFTVADACGSFDYNCDGTVTHEYSSSLHCSLIWSVGCISTCASGGCSTGYVGPDPGCGGGGAYDQCNPSGPFTCSPVVINPNQLQGCQ